MPRNAAGVYSLPDPPRVPNTVIDSPDENVTRDDIASELTNSLDRNGRGGMLAPFRIADGVQAAPGLAFLNEPGSGLYRIGAGDIALAVQGAKAMEWTATGVQVTGLLSVNTSAGASGLDMIGSLTLRRSGNPVRAMYMTMENGLAQFLMPDGIGWQFQFSTGTPSGVVKHLLNINEQSVHAQLVSLVIDPTWPFYLDGGGDTYISENPANTIQFVAGGIPRLNLGANANFTTNVALNPTQQLFLDGGSDTFIQEIAPNVLDIVVGAATKVRMTTAAVSNLFGQWAVSTNTPFFFDGGIDTYISEIGPNVLDLVAGAVTKVRMVGAVGVSNLFGPWGMVAGQPFYFDGGIDTYIQEVSPDVTRLVVGGNERQRCTVVAGTGGYSKFTDNGIYSGSASAWHELYKGANHADWLAVFTHAAPVTLNQFGIKILLAGDPNAAANYFWYCQGSGNGRAYMGGNGGLANYQANDTNLSDLTVKSYWEPYTDAQLEVLSAAVDALDFGRYKYTDQTHDDWNHGYAAQNVREAFAAAAPELVEPMNWGGKDDDEKKMLLSVYSTDFVNINLAVARHEIRKLKAEVEQLKARLQ